MVCNIFLLLVWYAKLSEIIFYSWGEKIYPPTFFSNFAEIYIRLMSRFIWTENLLNQEKQERIKGFMIRLFLFTFSVFIVQIWPLSDSLSTKNLWKFYQNFEVSELKWKITLWNQCVQMAFLFQLIMSRENDEVWSLWPTLLFIKKGWRE